VADRIQLVANAHTPRVARLFVGECLRNWGYHNVVGEAELLTSEVVTNAVLHAGGPVVVEVADLTDSILVVVDDPSAALPVERTPGPSDIGGRGLHILAASALAWGVALIRDGGKYVWFTIAVGPRVLLATTSAGG